MQIIATLASAAAQRNLPFLVIGGNAVITYGYPRHTIDVDLLVREQDRRAWDELIVPLGYRAHQIQAAFHMYNPRRQGEPPVDLMLVDADTFAKLSTETTTTFFAAAEVKVPSLAHLIALKLHALQPGAEHRFERDWSDVATLIEVNKVDLAKAPYPEIVERYGSPEIRARLQQLALRSQPPGA